MGSADGGYNGLSIASVAVSEQDNDTPIPPGITVTPTTLSIPEGESRSYTVVLNTRPTAGVRVRVSVSGDQRNSAAEFYCCGRSSVWLGTGDWNHPETFTVHALKEPGTANGTLWVRHWAESADPDYHGISVAMVTATAVDAGPVGLGTPSDLAFTVGQPLSGVVLPAAVGGSGGGYTYALTGQPSWIGFDPGTREMSGTPPAAAAGTTTTLDYTVTDTATNTSDTRSFTVTVNAAPSLTAPSNRMYIAGTPIPAFTLRPATGGTAPLRYELSGLPGGLTFTPSSRRLAGTPEAATTSPATVTYTVTDANGATDTDTFTVTVEAVEPGVSFSKLELSVPEGRIASYRVVLDAPPSDRVFISAAVGTGDESILLLGGSTLVFTPANWDRPKSVTLRAVEDSDRDNGTREITHEILADSASEYLDLPALPSVTATEVDNDGCGATAATDIWCTEMTVGSVTGFGGYCNSAGYTVDPNDPNDVAGGSCGTTNTGSLDDDTFVWAGTTHTVYNAGWRTVSGTNLPGAQFFHMDPLPARDAHWYWTLHVGDRTTVPFISANDWIAGSHYFANFYTTANPPPAAGAKIVVRLAPAAPSFSQPPAAGLEAHFGVYPAQHGGAPFETELHFSIEPNLSYRDVRDTLFTVTGGRITRAKRLEKGSNLGWRLTVEPDGAGAVSLDLPATTDCAAAGAVCTRDGQRLERGIAMTVEGAGDIRGRHP